MSTNSYIAKQLVKIMSDKGVTVKALAEKTGLAHGTISNIRNGRNHYSWQLKLICDELNVPMSLLLNESLPTTHKSAISALCRIKDSKSISVIESLIELLPK